jgi:hypothetical protein
MESNNVNNSSPIAKMIPVLVIFAGLLGLYYLYQYLFGPKMNNAYPLITATQDAHTDKPITFQPTALAPLYEGGEFTISTWIYISNWSVPQQRQNKHILNIGGNNMANGFSTILIYIDASSPVLVVKLDTHESTGSLVGSSSSTTSTPTGAQRNLLSTAMLTSTFTPSTIPSLNQDSDICNIHDIPMQRWVNVTIAVNAKVVDVYMDGKLSRSCVLPGVFKVDPSGYTGTLLNYGGFGGKISTTTMYDVALNPEMVYKNYMAGPEPITSIGGWFSSFFAPTVSMS